MIYRRFCRAFTCTYTLWRSVSFVTLDKICRGKISGRAGLARAGMLAGLLLSDGECLIGAEQLQFHPAVLGARGPVASGICRLFNPQANHLNAIDGDIVASHQIRHDPVRPATAELVVVGLGPGLVGESLNADEVPL